MEHSQALEELKRLARAQCPIEEICQAFRISQKDMEDFCQHYFKATFESIYEAAKTEGKTQIRLAQYDAALKGDKEMLRLLGKEVLKQGGDFSDDEKIQQVIVLPAYKPIGEKPEQGGKV